ncbi:MAG: insulinase family protein [Fimbriimonadaceae bacterium]|nr:insulinase family protein [Alphaproteobacteria bacterium]
MSVALTILDNGLRVITHEMPHLETASLGIWVNVGARSEMAGEHGISHFLEHMAFKGTKRRTALQIAHEIEAVGGDLNAATSLEYTAYYARILKDDLALAVDVLGDILRNPVFNQDEIAREKGVVIQEIGASLDAPDDIVFDLFQEAAFPDQPLGRTILGTPDTVRSFQSAHLGGYLSRHYHAPAMVLCAVGAIRHEDVVALAKTHCNGFDAGRDESPIEDETAQYVGGERRLIKDIEQNHILLGFEGVSYHDKDFYTAQVLAGVLGGGMSSRLFQEVREKRGLCYSTYAFHWAFRDTGLFGVYAATDDDKLGDLVPVLTGELIGAAEKIGEDEVSRVRAQVKSGIAMSLESTSARAEQIARQHLLFNRLVPVEELVDKVEAVSAKDVSALAGRLFCKPAQRRKMTLGAIGPLSQLESYDHVAERLS